MDIEFVAVFGGIAIALIAAFVNGMLRKRKLKQAFMESVLKKYGQFAESRNYKESDRERIASYHKKQVELGKTEFELDDITWNDLSMDAVFDTLNTTVSSIGEEYLYHMLRCPKMQPDEMHDFDSLVDFFDEHEEVRMKVMVILHEIGRLTHFSLTRILYSMCDLECRSNLPHYFMNAFLIVGFCTIFISPGIGTLLLIAALSLSIITYFKYKSEVYTYYTSFHYVLRMLSGIKDMEKMKAEALADDVRRMVEIRKLFAAFMSQQFLFSDGVHTTSNPLELLMDYLRLLFHADIIKFNSMLKCLQGHIDEIEELRAIYGRFDTAIAVASYRNALEVSCRPVFMDESIVCIKIEDGYHPLIKEAVKNSIEASGGVLLTGSNASGKSTFLKMVAICAIFAQTIGIVPAKQYAASRFRIYSSMALRDNLATSESYFIVEIKSLKRIVDATQEDQTPILCFVDEILRGTNTIERIAASSQILKGLITSRVICFGATHDIELAGILADYYENYHFEEELEKETVRFPFKLLKGKATTKNAIKLLGILGYDKEIVKSAEKSASHFEQTQEWETL